MPRISVVIPCFNHGQYIDEAVDSVLAQTFQDFEIIIVNDGSTDVSTVKKLTSYSKPKTTIIHISNGGVSKARNIGIESACGEYILPLDADDRIAPSYLEKACRLLDSDPNVDVVYCIAEFFGARSGIQELPEYSQERLLIQNLIFSSALYRKKLWYAVGGYRENMTHGWEDWDFWLGAAGRGAKIARIPEILFHYRFASSSRDNSMTLSHKVMMMLAIIFNNRGLYLRNFQKLKLREFVGRVSMK